MKHNNHESVGYSRPGVNPFTKKKDVARAQTKQYKRVVQSQAVLGNGSSLAQRRILPWWYIQREQKRQNRDAASSAKKEKVTPADSIRPKGGVIPVLTKQVAVSDKPKKSRASKRRSAHRRSQLQETRRVRRLATQLSKKLEVGTGFMPVLKELAFVLQTLSEALSKDFDLKMGLNTSQLHAAEHKRSMQPPFKWVRHGYLYDDAEPPKTVDPKTPSANINGVKKSEGEVTKGELELQKATKYFRDQSTRRNAAQLLKAIERAKRVVKEPVLCCACLMPSGEKCSMIGDCPGDARCPALLEHRRLKIEATLKGKSFEEYRQAKQGDYKSRMDRYLASTTADRKNPKIRINSAGEFVAAPVNDVPTTLDALFPLGSCPKAYLQKETVKINQGLIIAEIAGSSYTMEEIKMAMGWFAMPEVEQASVLAKVNDLNIPLVK